MTAKVGLRNRLLNSLNDFLHLPIVDETVWFSFWTIQLLLGPLWAGGLVGLWVNGLLRGNFFRRNLMPNELPILITGCDSGFGRMLAIRLHKMGWIVYAGCLTDRGTRTLQDEAPGIRALKLDVTKADDIDAAYERISRESPKGIWGLVNNAGIAVGACVDWTSMADYRKVMEVNFFAMVAMTKAFMPLLKHTKGRIVNLTSMAGLFHGAPVMSAYAASKHAAEAFTTSLRFEMKSWGIKVITVNPSFHRTDITDNAPDTVRQVYTTMDKAKQQEYGNAYLQVCIDLCREHTDGCWSAQRVVDALVHACVGTKPKWHYVLGIDAKYFLAPLLNLPTDVVEAGLISTKMQGFVPAARRIQDLAHASPEKKAQ